MSRDGAGLAALWLVVLAFNVPKAIHIDDPIFLAIAEQIVADPLHPMSGTLVESGHLRRIPDTHEPHLVPYLYALVIAVFGESPLALHLLHALFAAGALLAFHALARLACPDAPLLLTAVFALGPALLPAHNLMMDVPLLFLWMATARVLWTGLDAPGAGRAYALAASLLAAACLVKYTSLAFYPLLFLPLVWRRAWRWLPLAAIPLAVLGAWSLFNWLDYGEVHVWTRPRPEPVPSEVAGRAVDWLRALGAVSPFSLLFVPFAAARPRAAVGVGVAALAALALPLEPVGSGPLDPALSRVFLANGVLVLLLCGLGLLRLGRAQPERALFLAGWIAGPGAFIVLFAPFMAVRHVLLVVPPVLLSLAALLPARGHLAWWRAAGAATAALGVALAVSDHVYAGVNRRVVPELAERHAAGGRLYYLGDWGFGWYARRAGMEPFLLGRTELGSDDRLVVAANTISPVSVLAAAQGLRQVDRVLVQSTGATTLRTMLPWWDGGGYYGFRAPGLPWSTSERPLERFFVYAPRPR